MRGGDSTPGGGRATATHCHEYLDGRHVRDVELDEVGGIVATREANRFVWIGMQEPDEPSMRALASQVGLHPCAVEDAHEAHQRPKLEEYGESLYVVLRTVHLSSDPERRLDLGETHLFVGPGYLVSIRHGPSLSYADVRARCEARPELLGQGPAFALYAVMDFVVDQYLPVVDGLEEAVERLEEDVFADGVVSDRAARMHELKRDLLAVKRAVSPLVEMCSRLARFDHALIPPSTRPYFRDVYDHVVRLNESADMQRELLSSTLEANLTQISVHQNEVTKKLASWAAIVALPTMISGIYGMNFHAMPGLDWRFGYPVVLGLMVGVAGGLYWRFKSLGWL